MIVQWPTGQCTLPQAHSYLHSFWKSAGKQPELARLLPLPSQLHGKLPQLPVTARGTAVPAQGVESISHPPKAAHILLFYNSVTWAQALRTCGMVPIKEPLEALSPKESVCLSPGHPSWHRRPRGFLTHYHKLGTKKSKEKYFLSSGTYRSVPHGACKRFLYISLPTSSG